MSYYSASSNQYGTQQTSAQNIPQQQRRQSVPQAPLASSSPQVPPKSDYPEQSGYPSYNPQAQQGYIDPYTGYLTAAQGNPAFPEPHSPSAGGSVQRSHSGQSGTHYSSASSSAQRSYSGQSGTHYPPSSSSSSLQRGHSGQSATHYPPASNSVQHSYSEQSATHYPPAGNSGQHIYSEQPSPYYPPAQTYDSTNTTYPGSQPTSHHVVPHGHGTHASDGSRSSNRHLYSTTAPVTRVTPDPPYRGAERTQERGVAPSQPHHQEVYEYDNVDEHRPKSPGRGPVQGRQYNCRLPGCNQPMFFDRRFNEFWEWCSPQHIHAALGRRIEKACKHCGVWPRKYGHKYCGGPSCNKNGIPISSY